MDTETETHGSEEKSPKRGRRSNGNGEAGEAATDDKPTVSLIGGEQLIDELVEDSVRLLRRAAPTIISGVEQTAGSEKAAIKLTATFNPGGKGAKRRFDLVAKVDIPVGSTARKVEIIEDDDGHHQLRMFADAEAD